MKPAVVRINLLALAAAVGQASLVAQTNPSPSVGILAQRAGALIDTRATEIRALRPSNQDVEFATSALALKLKADPRVLQTVVEPCPPSPGPDPIGRWRERAAADGRARWADQMPNYVGDAKKGLVTGSELTARQKVQLSEFVAPRFVKPGGSGKFEVVVSPDCPGPAPEPAGKVAPPLGMKK